MGKSNMIIYHFRQFKMCLDSTLQNVKIWVKAKIMRIHTIELKNKIDQGY